MLSFYLSVVPLLLMSRAGGGGSSSSGGGASGGSAYGGDIAVVLLFFGGFFVGAIVSAVLAMKLRKRMKNLRAARWASSIVTALTSILLIYIVSVYFRTSTAAWWLGISLASSIWLGWGLIALTESKQPKIPVHYEKGLRDKAVTLFLRYQENWSHNDTSTFSEYMTPHYAQHASLMIRALKEMNRQNDVVIKAVHAWPTMVNDDTGKFSALFHTEATDNLYENPEHDRQTLLFSDKNDFWENWEFKKNHEGEWAIANIQQTTEAPEFLESDLRQFAEQNHMFFSLDMGWLFIPSRGVLFSGKNIFGTSDINNHVIGTSNDHLVQLYTFTRPASVGTHMNTYLVGQLQLPKSYGGILIQRKKLLPRLVLKPPKEYMPYTFEWADFQKRYKVHATEADRVAAFELLNPGFMQFIYDTFNDLNIEAVDNVVYFYVRKKGERDDYEKLLGVLNRAFKELQL